MSEILTAENIVAIEARYRPQEAQRKYGLRTLLLEVVDSHEALREELAKAQREGSAICLGWNQALDEAQADVRALAALLPDLDIACSHCKNRIDEALARPGVQRIMEEQETE